MQSEFEKNLIDAMTRLLTKSYSQQLSEDVRRSMREKKLRDSTKSKGKKLIK